MLNNIVGVLGVGGGVATNFDSIATATGTGSSATITFSSIPSTYKHLQIRGIIRNSNASSGAGSMWMQFNSDSGTNYAYHILYGNGTSANAFAQSGVSNATVADAMQNGSTASTMSVAIVDILDYANTNKNKTSRSLYGWDLNGSGIVALDSTLWINTNAITSISLITGSNFTTATTFALYGIKA